MDKLKTFGREHVLRNTAPMPTNKYQFKDRRGNKLKVRGGYATITHFYGHLGGQTAWWCELDNHPGNFVLRSTRNLARFLIAGEAVEPAEVNEIGLTRELGKISIFGSVPQFVDGKIWVALRCLCKIDSRLYSRVYSRVKHSPESLKVMHDRPVPVCSVGRAVNQVMHVEFSYLEDQLKKNGPDFNSEWVKNRMGAGWDAIVNVREKYLRKPVAQKQAVHVEAAKEAPEVTVEVIRQGEDVDLLPYIRETVEQMFSGQELKDPQVADQLSRKIANNIFMNKDIERRVMFKKEDVDAILSPEFKLNSLLGVLSSK